MLQFLDVLLTLFHSLFVLFVLLGWIFPATRKIHRIALATTLGAWLILGIWYGIGYCPLTDWHWDIKRSLGEKKLPYSFIKYMVDKITGWNTNRALVDWITAGGMVFSVIMAIVKSKPFLKHLSRKKN